MTLDDGKQRFVYSEEHSLVALWGQVVKWHRLQRSEDHDHMMRIGDEPLPLAQQRCHWGDSMDRKGKGERSVLARCSDETLEERKKTAGT